MYEYRAKILTVHDGDTCLAQIDLGFDVAILRSLRLNGLNAPEVTGPQRKDGEVARDFLAAMIQGKTVVIRTTKDRNDKYGRMLAEILLNDGRNVNAEMIRTGHAVVWDGKGPRPVQ